MACSNGFTAYYDSCFLATQTYQTYYDSKTTCEQNHNSSLISFDSFSKMKDFNTTFISKVLARGVSFWVKFISHI